MCGSARQLSEMLRNPFTVPAGNLGYRLPMDSYRPATLALTGGTGALGFAFLQRIFRQDPKLTARLLVRSSSSSFQSDSFQGWLKENESRLMLIDGDMRGLDAKQLAALLETEGGLWHFAALTALNVNSEQVTREINEVNLEGTQRLVEAALAQRRSRPFYHISTAYVAGDRTGLARECEGNLGQASRNPYEASKLAAETSAQRAFAAGIFGAIFRPSVVVDDGTATGGFKMVDACAYAVALAVKRGEPFVFRLPADARINLVHSGWVIAAMIDLAPDALRFRAHLSSHRAARHLLPRYRRDPGTRSSGAEVELRAGIKAVGDAIRLEDFRQSGDGTAALPGIEDRFRPDEYGARLIGRSRGDAAGFELVRDGAPAERTGAGYSAEVGRRRSDAPSAFH